MAEKIDPIYASTMYELALKQFEEEFKNLVKLATMKVPGFVGDESDGKPASFNNMGNRAIAILRQWQLVKAIASHTTPMICMERGAEGNKDATLLRNELVDRIKKDLQEKYGITTPKSKEERLEDVAKTEPYKVIGMSKTKMI